MCLFQGSLDSVEDLCGGEMRRVVDVVSLLVFSSSTHAALQDELIILVRKQLSHTDLRYSTLYSCSQFVEKLNCNWKHSRPLSDTYICIEISFNCLVLINTTVPSERTYLMSPGEREIE